MRKPGLLKSIIGLLLGLILIFYTLNILRNISGDRMYIGNEYLVIPERYVVNSDQLGIFKATGQGYATVYFSPEELSDNIPGYVGFRKSRKSGDMLNYGLTIAINSSEYYKGTGYYEKIWDGFVNRESKYDEEMYLDDVGLYKIILNDYEHILVNTLPSSTTIMPSEYDWVYGDCYSFRGTHDTCTHYVNINNKLILKFTIDYFNLSKWKEVDEYIIGKVDEWVSE